MDGMNDYRRDLNWSERIQPIAVSLSALVPVVVS